MSVYFTKSLNKASQIEDLDNEVKKIIDLDKINDELNELSNNKADSQVVLRELEDLKEKIKKINDSLKNLSGANFQDGGITSDKITITDGFIKDAMIEGLSAGKITSGSFDTTKADIVSENGNLIIKDNTIQIRDTSKVRVQIGKDASGDYNMYVWDVNGNLMFNATGITANAIKNKIIRDDMVSDNANIDGKKLNIESLIREVNNSGSTIKASKINLDNVNQTLEIAFKELSTENDNNKKNISSALTKIEVQQGQIETSISNSKIIKDKQEKLENDYNNTVVTVNSIKNTIGQHTTLINNTTGKVESVESKTNTLEKNLDSVTQTIQETKKTVADNQNILEKKTSELKQSLDGISASVGTLKETTNIINKSIDSVNNNLSNDIKSNFEKAITTAENLVLEKSNIAKKYADDVAAAKAELAKQEAIANSDGKIDAEEKARIQQAQENLNTAISKADKAKQEAILEANRVAELKKQEAINLASQDASNKANAAKEQAIADSKNYINTQVSTVNQKISSTESNLNILKDKINTKVGQADIDKSILQVKTDRVIYARGTGNDYPGNSYVRVGSVPISDGQNRGLRVIALNPSTLKQAFLQDYDTFGGGDATNNNFANKINELNNGNFIIIVTSQDASYPLNPTVKGALEKIGATLFDNKQGTYREAYALIGKSKLGRGNGVEMFIPRTANDKRFAEVSVKVGEDGTFIGLNPNNLGLETTLINTKINDVSSSLEQTKNSITASINSINSKTSSLESNLNGKAAKNEVSEVNNKVSSIQANVNGITQRVSNTESKTNSLETIVNGKATKEELTTTNKKVTDIQANVNGITQRVSSAESKINTIDGKVNNAVTNEKFTEFKQSVDNFNWTVGQRSNVSNLLPNSTFEGGIRGWQCGCEFWSGAYGGYDLKGRICAAIRNKNYFNNEKFLQTYKAYKVKKNTTYTINFHYVVEQNVDSMDAYVILSDSESCNYVQAIQMLNAKGGTQSKTFEGKPFSFKFNTGKHEYVWLRFDHNGMKSGSNVNDWAWIYISEIGLYEGDVGQVTWSAKGGENYSTRFTMDEVGLQVNYNDGSYTSLTKDGFEWYNAENKFSYHALTYVAAIGIPAGNPGRAWVKLPKEFTKRKDSLRWTVALRGYYYSTSGNFFPMHVHCSGGNEYEENGLIVCPVEGYCKIQNAQNMTDKQDRPVNAMIIAIA
ncbi:hypothetical protein FKF97_10820 [Clostridium perfringens]|nr:hypothetical protein [Clostridium perfringens]